MVQESDELHVDPCTAIGERLEKNAVRAAMEGLPDAQQRNTFARCGASVGITKPRKFWEKWQVHWSPEAEVPVSYRPRHRRGFCSIKTPRTVAASYNRTWAELMRRGLDIDVLQCPDCVGRLRFVAVIVLSSAIQRILRHLGLPSDPVERAPARAPPEFDDAWEGRQGL